MLVEYFFAKFWDKSRKWLRARNLFVPEAVPECPTSVWLGQIGAIVGGNAASIIRREPGSVGTGCVFCNTGGSMTPEPRPHGLGQAQRIAGCKKSLSLPVLTYLGISASSASRRFVLRG